MEQQQSKHDCERAKQTDTNVMLPFFMRGLYVIVKRLGTIALQNVQK